MRAVNLIPSDQRSGGSVGAGRSGGGAYAVVVLLVGLALLALLYGKAKNQLSSDKTQVAAVTNQAQQAQAEAGRLAPYTSFIALREARTQAVAQLVNSRFDWAHAFHELGRVLPPEISINSLTGAVGSTTTGGGAPAAAAPHASASSAAPAAASASSASSGAVASSTPPGTVPTFTLGGCATSQPAVALMLERLRLIDGVSEVTLQSSTKSSSGTSSSGAGGGGGCPKRAATFTAQVTFDPLPTVAAASAAASKPVADTSGAGKPSGTGVTAK